jgi:hypothetical protein
VTKLYIAGPMSGYADFNYPAFRSAAEQLRAAGYAVGNPADLDGTGLPYKECIRLGLALLFTCDHLALLPGWERSRGAVLERQAAATVGMEVWTVDWWLAAAEVIT